jgi:integrase
MGFTKMALSQTRADKITKPGRYKDERNLFLQITPSGARSWIFRYEIHGRERAMGLGACRDFTLDQARERAGAARRLLKDNVDPLAQAHEARAQAAAAAAQMITFKVAAAGYYEVNKKEWTSKKHREQFHSRMATFVFPTLGNLPVQSIDKALVLAAIKPIWQTRNPTAQRTLRQIAGVLNFAKASGWCTGDNPAVYADFLESALPAITSSAHHPSLPFAQMFAFMQQLAEQQGVVARALEFTVLTAARTGETLGAVWGEIDMTTKVWIIPAARMKVKSGKEHRVPLSNPALEILKALPREQDNSYVFIGAQKGKGLGESSLHNFLKRIRTDVTVHGFRSTFSTWANECTRHDRIVIELSLAHKSVSNHSWPQSGLEECVKLCAPCDRSGRSAWPEVAPGLTPDSIQQK